MGQWVFHCPKAKSIKACLLYVLSSSLESVVCFIDLNNYYNKSIGSEKENSALSWKSDSLSVMLFYVKSYVQPALSPRTLPLDMLQDSELLQNFRWGSCCRFSIQWYFSQSQFWSLINSVLFSSIFCFLWLL